MTPRILSILIAGSAIAFISFGVRSTMGHFNTDMTVHSVVTNGWEYFGTWSLASTITFGGFSFALALQNLVWGITQPFSWQPGRSLWPHTRHVLWGLVVFFGHCVHALFHPELDAVFRRGIAGHRYFLYQFQFGDCRLYPPIAWGLAGLAGLGTAMGSAGQMVLNPFVAPWLGFQGWETALVVIGGLCLLVIPAALVLTGSDSSVIRNEGQRQSVREAIAEAFANRSYILLVIGFFVCGFHLAFITVHMPRYLEEELAMGNQVSGWFLSQVGI